jgi:hypothetical protein
VGASRAGHLHNDVIMEELEGIRNVMDAEKYKG